MKNKNNLIGINSNNEGKTKKNFEDTSAIYHQIVFSYFIFDFSSLYSVGILNDIVYMVF